MTTTLFQQQSDLAVPVANDVPAGAVRASILTLPAVSGIVAHRNDDAETMIFVEEGEIELAVNGIEGYLSQGEFARIAPGAHFAYRNKSKGPARLFSVPMVRTASGLRAINGTSTAA
jgi:glyoxylate utilization-related uncharacterized protein